MMRRAALSLAVLLAATTAGTARAADTVPAAASAAAAASAPLNDVQKLVQERKYADAILLVDQLRKAAGKPLADAESEYWGARAVSANKDTEGARARMLAIAKAYPDQTRGRDAAIEATTVRLNTLGEKKASTPEEIKMATDCAKELEETAGKLKDPEGISRAWYVSGNAWRVMGNEEAAAKAYEKARAVPGAVDYPAKAVYSLSTRALQKFDVAGTKALLQECMTKYAGTTSADKCGKAMTRLTLLGTPAPALDVETWLNGPPQKISALKGRVVLVWFFATWCPHCKATMPEIAAMKKRFEGKPLTIIGITNNTKEQTTETAAAFVADPQYGITYPAAVDRGGATSLAFQGTGIPAAALIDKKGIVRWADHPTFLTDEMISKLLAE